MGLFGNKNDVSKPQEGGIMDAIRCDETDYLIWKWHPKGNVGAGATKKENAIRYGSSLNVKDGEVAVFVYHQKDGTQQDFIEGPYNDTIKTANFPVLSSIVGLAFGGGTPFQAEVYYINMAGLINMQFGVPYFNLYDPRLQEIPVPVAVRGSIKFSITDYKEFIKLHRLTNFDMDDFKRQVKDSLIKYVKGSVVGIPSANKIPLVQIETQIFQVNEIVENYIRPKLSDTFGVQVKSFDITDIEIDKTSEGWNKVKSLTVDFTEAQMRQQQKFVLSDQETAHSLQTENLVETQKLQMENLKESQRAQMENMRETLRIQREEGQFAQHQATEANTYAAKLAAEQQNIGAFGIKNQTQVGIASAEAMGKMASAGTVDLGGGSTPGGINPGAMMANMAMGQSIGTGMANMMGNAFGAMNQNFGALGSGMQGMPAQGAMQMPQTPPVPGAVAYNVAVNGASAGPFTLEILRNMVQSGQLTAQSLVWTTGMANWTAAGSVPELASLFGATPQLPTVPPSPPPIG